MSTNDVSVVSPRAERGAVMLEGTVVVPVDADGKVWRVLLAAALSLAVSLPAAAGNNGLSNKQTNQVRTIVKQEVKKIPRVRGPAGPKGSMGAPGTAGPAGPQGARGPAGMDGMPFLHAHVHFAGFVVGDEGGGITDENVRLVETRVPDGDGGTVISSMYCFVGLPPVVGGQVTIIPFTGENPLAHPVLLVNKDDEPDPECPIFVLIGGPEFFPSQQASFYILLY